VDRAPGVPRDPYKRLLDLHKIIHLELVYHLISVRACVFKIGGLQKMKDTNMSHLPPQ
jgi:hypothetical protein